MKSIKKFIGFDELKSHSNSTSSQASKLKKHDAFFKVISEIRLAADKNGQGK